MLMMRLQRVGRRNDPSYRVVVTDKRTGPKSNKHVDLLGSYNPKMDHVQIDAERAKDWIGKGVQLSDTVHNILVGQKIIDGKKVNVLPKKSPIAKETEESAEETKAPEGGDAPAEAPAAESAPEEEKEADAKSAEEEPKTEETAEAEEETVEEESEKKE